MVWPPSNPLKYTFGRMPLRAGTPFVFVQLLINLNGKLIHPPI